jgi:hypothetical protein
MRRMLATTLVLLTLAGGSAFAQQFSSLEERMSAAEFKAAGLDKLSPEELARLNAWLSREVDETAREVAASAPLDSRGLHTSGDIATRIVGKFTGWNGRDGRFTLSNGQVWQSIDPNARFGGVELDNPEVVVEQGAFGSWYLSVVGYNSRVQVKRVK